MYGTLYIRYIQHWVARPLAGAGPAWGCHSMTQGSGADRPMSTSIICASLQIAVHHDLLFGQDQSERPADILAFLGLSFVSV